MSEPYLIYLQSAKLTLSYNYFDHQQDDLGETIEVARLYKQRQLSFKGFRFVAGGTRRVDLYVKVAELDEHNPTGLVPESGLGHFRSDPSRDADDLRLFIAEEEAPIWFALPWQNLTPSVDAPHASFGTIRVRLPLPLEKSEFLSQRVWEFSLSINAPESA